MTFCGILEKCNHNSWKEEENISSENAQPMLETCVEQLPQKSQWNSALTNDDCNSGCFISFRKHVKFRRWKLKFRAGEDTKQTDELKTATGPDLVRPVDRHFDPEIIYNSCRG